MGSGCQRAQICSLTMLHASHLFLVCLSFYTMPICLIRRIFNLLVSFNYSILRTTYVSVKEGKHPIKINNREKCLHPLARLRRSA